MITVIKPAVAQSASSRLSTKEQLSRAQAVSQGARAKPACVADVHVGMFFDGTNNNKKRDQEDVSNPNERSHSNVAVLFDTYNDKRPKHFRYYVPGVGTPFPDIGEMSESREGKSMAKGGEARIHWAMIQVLNAAHSDHCLVGQGNGNAAHEAGRDLTWRVTAKEKSTALVTLCSEALSRWFDQTTRSECLKCSDLR